MIRVLIADRCPLLREGLRKKILGAGNFVIVAETSSEEEVLAEMQRAHIDVAVLDLDVAEGSGFFFLERVRARRPALPLLVWGFHDERWFALQVFRLGASGYVSKTETANQIIKAIHIVAQGKKFVDVNVIQELAKHLDASTKLSGHKALSTRELEVMQRIVRGEETQEIAAALSLSPKTISTYRGRILAKMGLRNDVELANYALKYNLFG